MGWLLSGVLAAAAWSQPMPPPVRSLPSSPEKPRPLGLVGTVLGVIEYTRWPGPARPLAVCVAGNGPQSVQLAAAVLPSRGDRPLRLRALAPNQGLPDGCDAVFFEGWREPELHEALAALDKRPVLTIGNGSGFCASGGLFCLQPGAAGPRFAVNTDAVARSGLVVHPRVLQLGRRADSR